MESSKCPGNDVNINEMCRLCLKQSNDLIGIFENSENLSLAMRIMTCVSLVVSQTDSLPKKVCPDCRYQLEKSYYFRHQSKRSDHKLRKHVRLVNTGKVSRVFQTREEDDGEDDVDDEDDIKNCLEYCSKWEREKQKEMEEEFEKRMEQRFEELEEEHLLSQEKLLKEAREKTEKEVEDRLRTEIEAKQLKNRPENRLDADDSMDILNSIEPVPPISKMPIKTDIKMDSSDNEMESLIEFEVHGDEDPENSENDMDSPTDDQNCDLVLEKIDDSNDEHYQIVYDDATSADRIVSKTLPVVLGSFNNGEKQERKSDVEMIPVSSDETDLHNQLKVIIASKLGLDADEDLHTLTYNLIHDSGNKVVISAFIDTEESLTQYHIDLDDEHEIELFKKINCNKIFRCEQCPKAFARRIQLLRHASDHKILNGYKCIDCDKLFSTPSSLVRHQRIHTGEKPFVCTICNRGFIQKEILKRHINTHTGNKPFVCRICDKGFTQKTLRTDHINRKHNSTAELPQHKCPLCPKFFRHASGLSRHLLIHTGVQYICPHCGKNFNDASAFKRHRLALHKDSYDEDLTSGP